MASNLAFKQLESFKGLILLASYSTKKLDANTRVLSLYGTEDGVLNFEKYEAAKINLPEDFQEVVIDGGNHAGFGYYGEQKKDKTAKISKEEQQKKTIKVILKFVD